MHQPHLKLIGKYWATSNSGSGVTITHRTLNGVDDYRLHAAGDNEVKKVDEKTFRHPLSGEIYTVTEFVPMKG